MAFKFKNSGNETTSTENRVQVDFNALNQHIVDAVEAEQPETVQGVIAGIVDLGEQVLPDSEYPLDGERELNKTIDELNKEFAEEISEGKISKFAESWNGQTKRKEIMKFVPQKNRHCVDIFVDFPDVLVNKGQFFNSEGESEEKPYRMTLGGEFYQKGKGMKLLQRPIPLRLVKDDTAGWTMPVTSILYKMALAGKLINKGEAFLPEDIDKLLGVNLQFTIHVYMKEGKEGRKYLTENIKFASGLGKKMNPVTDYPTFLIQFDDENKEDDLKQLRKVQISQMQQSPNFKGSKIEEQLESRLKYQNPTQKSDEKDTKEKGSGNSSNLDEDLPF